MLLFASREGGLRRPDARAVLAAAATPGQAAALNLAKLRTALVRGGRHRGIQAEAARLKTVFATQQLRQLPLVEQAMGRQAVALLRQRQDRPRVHPQGQNQRLAAAGYVWAFASLTASPPARAHYDRRRQPVTGTSPPNATCSTACSAALHHCLTTRQTYDPAKAFPTPATAPA